MEHLHAFSVMDGIKCFRNRTAHKKKLTRINEVRYEKGISEYQLKAHKRETEMSGATRNLNKYTSQ